MSASPKVWSILLRIALVATILAFLFGLLYVAFAVPNYVSRQADTRAKMQAYESAKGTSLSPREMGRLGMAADLSRHALTYMVNYLQVHRYLPIPAALGAVLWMVWQYLTRKRLLERKPREGKYRPHAVLWWLVPLANLVVPYNVVRQVAEDSGIRYSPVVLRLWNLAAVLAPLPVAAYFLLEDRLDVWNRHWLYIALGLGDILFVFAAWTGMVLVTRIQRAAAPNPISLS